MYSLRIIFVRHGEKEKGCKNDNEAPLSMKGKDLVRERGKILKEFKVEPDVYFSSSYRHSMETTEILREIFNNDEDKLILRPDALTPCTDERLFNIENIKKKALEKKLNLKKFEGTALFVGHEPRIGQLITIMTGKRFRPFNKLDLVCIEAEDFNEIQRGNGKIAWRYPVKDYQEKRLAQKLTSKTTVATFLAGFTFAALFEVLTSKQILRAEKILNWEQVNFLGSEFLLFIACLFLTAAMGLFIASENYGVKA